MLVTGVATNLIIYLFVDLCSGVGGFHVAVRGVSAKARCVGYSEIDGAASACYEANFKGVPALGDARTAAWPRADLLVAGFPCTAFSVCNNAERRAAHPLRAFYKVVLRALSAVVELKRKSSQEPTRLDMLFVQPSVPQHDKWPQ